MPNLLVLGGGPYHPIKAQVAALAQRVPGDWRIQCVEGREAFARLDDADLFIGAGLHWTGMGDGSGAQHKWAAGEPPVPYLSPTAEHRAAWKAYVQSGKPVLGFHAGIASFDDWPDYAALLGFKWKWGFTYHPAPARFAIKVDRGVLPGAPSAETFETDDELYAGLQVGDVDSLTVHAWHESGPFKHPVVITARGGQARGKGKAAYYGLGHTVAALENERASALLVDTLQWLLAP